MANRTRSRHNGITFRRAKMRLVTVNLQDIHVALMGSMLRFGLYPSRSEIIRVAIKNFLMRELQTARKIRDMEDTIAKLERFLPKEEDVSVFKGIRREAYDEGKKPEQYHEEIANHVEVV